MDVNYYTLGTKMGIVKLATSLPIACVHFVYFICTSFLVIFHKLFVKTILETFFNYQTNTLKLSGHYHFMQSFKIIFKLYLILVSKANLFHFKHEVHNLKPMFFNLNHLDLLFFSISLTLMLDVNIFLFLFA